MSTRRDDINNEEIRYLYNIKKWTQQKIADYLGVSQMTVYYRLHPEKLKEHKAKRKVAVKEYMKEYNQTENGKAARKRYGQTEKGIAAKKKYWQTEKGIAAKKRFWDSENGKLLKNKVNALRRELDFIPVNAPFEGGEYHHIDFDHVICMPAELHRSIYHNLETGEGMEEINEVAFEYVTEEEFERLESGELDGEAAEN